MKLPLARSRWLAVCGAVSLWFSLQAVSASPIAPLSAISSPSSPAAFGQALFQAGEYYRAIGELQRFLLFAPEHPLVSEAQLTIGLAYFCGRGWLPAYEVFRQVTRAAPDPAVRREASLWMAETRAQGGDQPEAIRLYRDLIRQDPGSPLAQRAAYLVAWSFMRQGRWAEARQVFAEIDSQSPYDASAQRLTAVLTPPPDLPQRSPATAKMLSTLVPGSGQIYAGEIADGLIDFGVHGALAAATAGAALVGLEGTAGLSAFFTWGFYRTQRANAAQVAQDFNARTTERFIGQLAAQEGAFLQRYARQLPCRPL